jgi:hypothetical protein
MEIKDGTEALSKVFAEMSKEGDEIESVHKAELSLSQLSNVMTDPKSVVKALGIQVSDESQVQVTVKHRAQRQSQVFARRKRIVVIVIHYGNCDSDIIVITS